MSRPVWLLRGAFALGVVAAGCAASVPAQAATPGIARTITANKVEFRAASGKVNKVTVTGAGRVVTIDDVVAIRAGQGCRAVSGDATRVRCTTTNPTNSVRVYTGDRNDTITSGGVVGISGYAGPGNDVLRGGAEHDLLDGQAGNDKVYAGGGNGVDGNGDSLRGGDGHDILVGDVGRNGLEGGAGNDSLAGGGARDELSGGPGNDSVGGGGGDDHIDEPLTRYAADRDVLAGGSGRDRLSYHGRTTKVKVDSDGVKGDDGSPGEGDTVSGMEEIFGGNGADTLYGTAGDDLLYGGDGNDVLHGLGGNDDLNGAAGRDRLYGEAGDDRLSGEDRRYSSEPDIEPEPIMTPDLLDGGPDGTALGDSCKVLEFDTAVACERP